MTEERLRDRLEAVRERIAAAAARAGRDAGDVEILPITKGHPAHYVRHVAEAGLAAVGENRLGEAEEKRTLLGGDMGLRWHMVGRLQGRKAGRAARLFDVVESVDRPGLAERLSRGAREAGVELEVLVQVNTSGEEAKAGFAPETAVEGVRAVCALSGLRVAGLMTMAPLTDREDVLRRTFREARRLFDACAGSVEGFGARVLSMGMTNDFEVAVEEGSTRVRLGTALFGDRPSGSSTAFQEST